MNIKLIAIAVVTLTAVVLVWSTSSMAGVLVGQ